MSETGLAVLGMLTFWPLVYFVLFFALMASAFVAVPMNNAAPPPSVFAIFPLHFFTMFEMFGLTAYYAVNVYREPLLQGDRKILWMVIVLLGGIIGQGIYYVLWLRKRSPAVIGEMPAPRQLPSWQPDPTGRHELRYWDGASWTSHVSDGGQTEEDPVWHPPAPDPDDTFDSWA